MQTGGARMWLMAGVVAGLCGGGCYDEDPTGPRRLAAPVAQVLVTADTACVRARFNLTGPTTVQTQVPERADCATSLVLIRAQPAEWAQNPHRQLRFFVRILNTSGAAIQLPVRLYLPATGTTVEVPAGTPASKVVPVNADSTDAGGGKIWFLGGTSILAVGDSTALDTLGFNVQSPVDQARWQFQATAMAIDTSPPAMPGNWVPPSDSTNAIALDAARRTVVHGDIFTLEFSPAATGQQIQSVLSKYEATIVGGLPDYGPRGTYVIHTATPALTLGAVDSTVLALRGEPGVQSADRIYYRVPLVPRARFPVDGHLVSSRSAWSDSSRATIAWRAIRAQLGWGCETGAYGGSGPLLGVLDLTLDSLPDLPVLRRVTPLGALVLDTAYLSGVDSQAMVSRSHGLAVSGIITAVGNNRAGIAGLLWESSTVFYALGSRDSVSRLPSRFLTQRVLPDLQASGVRLLVTATGYGESSDSSAVAEYRQWLEPWLQQSPMNLFVYPMDERGSRKTLVVVATAPDTALAASDRAIAQLALMYPNQIILVGGSRPGSRTFWPQSGFWSGSGGTAILAPAESVLTLAHVSDFAVDSRLADGTSYAAPMVAGVAAQVMTMDSTLTAAEVKDYILRGAQEPLLDSLTGLPVQRQPVSGAPGTVYQLDAYGSLSLLSRERQHLPACGFPVALHGTLTSQPWVVFTRNGANADSFQLTGFNPDLKFSIAQGGRRLAAPSMDSAGQFVTHEFVRSGPSWTQVNSVPGVRSRTYLEEDTVDALQDERTWVLRGSRWGGSGTTINFPALVNPSDPNTGVGFVRFSPEGSFAVVRASGAPCSNQFARDEAFLVAIPSGTVTPLLNLQCSAGDNERYAMDVTWHPDANRFVLAERNDALIQSILYPRKVSGSGVIPDGNDVLIADRLIIDQFSGPDAHLSEPSGAIAVWKEYTLNGVGGCHLTSRTFRGGVFVSQVSLPFSDPVWGLNCQVPVPTLRHTSGIRPAATRRGP